MTAEEWEKKWGSLPQEPFEEKGAEIERLEKAFLVRASKEVQKMIADKDSEIARLKAEVDMQIRIGAKILRKYSATQSLLTRAADALTMWAKWPKVPELIAELRKAAE